MINQVLSNVHVIAQILYEKKALNLLALDVRGLSTLTDFIIIAEGHVDRHVSSLGRSVIDEMEIKGIPPMHIEGMSEGDWVVIDYGEIVVHLFKPGFRERYSLERLCPESKIVDLQLNLDRDVMAN